MAAILPLDQKDDRKDDRKDQRKQHPLLLLAEEDLDFVVQFVLASGSLKEMAMLHQVSYPTIRATLDRVIANLRQSLPPWSDFAPTYRLGPESIW